MAAGFSFEVPDGRVTVPATLADPPFAEGCALGQWLGGARLIFYRKALLGADGDYTAIAHIRITHQMLRNLAEMVRLALGEP